VTERIDTLASTIDRWHCTVTMTLAGQRTRHVALTFDTGGDDLPHTFMIPPDDAEQIGRALQHYAIQAKQRDQGEHN
jgi:hypothetical protein